MKTTLRKVVCTLSLCLLAGAALAQITPSQRVFLPNGQPVQQPIDVKFESDDMTINRTFTTDSKGVLVLQGIDVNKYYNVTVIGDGRTFATTKLHIKPAIAFEIYLNPVEGLVKTASGAIIDIGELKPPAPKAKQLHDEGLEALRNRKYDAAEKKFRGAMQADPDFSAPYNDLSALYIMQRKYVEAEQIASDGLKKNATSPRLLYNRGAALNYLGKYEDAKAPLHAALKKLPNWVNAEAQLGISLTETDQLAAARPCLERGIKAEGIDQSFSYLYLGKLHAQQGTFAEAVYAWEQYLKNNANTPNAVQVKNLLDQIRPMAQGTVTEIQPSGTCE